MNKPYLLPNNRLVSLQYEHPLEPYFAENETLEADFLHYLRSRVIGSDLMIQTPYGKKPLRYFDYTASGRFHADIEDELNEQVLPFMANTHTETSATGRLMTKYFHESFHRIAHYINASEEDVLIPVGSGSTGAINRMINVLGLRPSDMHRHLIRNRPPLVIRSKMEHHSNDIAWRETIAETVFSEFTSEGTVDLNHLEQLVKEHADGRMIIGTFSAASNVTGIDNDVDGIARIMHKYGGYAFFDYAAAAPHSCFDMHPEGDEEARKDAVFLSTHKLIGGPRTPGLLVAHKSLFRNRTPIEPGGGTVLYTSPWDYRFTPDIFARETGGTPPIVQSIQAGLVFDLKRRIGCERIERIEQDYLRRALAKWSQLPNLMLLGNIKTHRHATISLVFLGLHHEFVVALLNDLFGIQARGGCMCAGTYGHELLDIDRMHSEFIRHNIIDVGHLAGKPGWVRISISVMTREDELEALLDAVEYVAAEGHKHLPDYLYDEERNCWFHKDLK